MKLNIYDAYKAVEILRRDSVLSVDYIGEDKFVASSCGYAEHGATALEATIKLFRKRYPYFSLSFVTEDDPE